MIIPRRLTTQLIGQVSQPWSLNSPKQQHMQICERERHTHTSSSFVASVRGVWSRSELISIWCDILNYDKFFETVIPKRERRLLWKMKMCSTASLSPIPPNHTPPHKKGGKKTNLMFQAQSQSFFPSNFLLKIKYLPVFNRYFSSPNLCNVYEPVWMVLL